jgi:hypothetical protein
LIESRARRRSLDWKAESMSNAKPLATHFEPPARSPSRQVLADLPTRVVLFLNAVSRNAEIRSLLLRGGYTATTHREGWELLHAVCDYPAEVSDRASDERARLALSEIDRFARAHFRRFRATVERFSPDLADLFPSLPDHDANASLIAVAVLLNWFDTADSAAQNTIINTLAERGFTRVERERLQSLMELAKTAPQIEALPIDADARERALVALYGWYSDWSATARTLIRRKDFRYSLGIGERQPRKTVSTALPFVERI